MPRVAGRLECASRPFTIHLEDGGSVRARTVVIATGARYRALDQVPDAARFDGRGIHYAATPLEASLCGGEELVVVGGGNSAGQAAVFLTTHARHVHILVRSSGLAATMSKYLVDRIKSSDRITVHTHAEIVSLGGEHHLERVRWRDSRTGAEQERPIGNVFLMVGATPNTQWLRGTLELDEHGFIRTGTAVEDDSTAARQRGALETSRPGVFAVGDVRSGSTKRVASAVGEGAVVVSLVHGALSALAASDPGE